VNNRARILNSAPVRGDADYVMYWAQVNRRVESNHALAYAAEMANELRLPLLYYEELSCASPYAGDRSHTFILEGVPDTAAALTRRGIGYCFHVRRRQSDPEDALYRVAEKAAAVISDDYPAFAAAGINREAPAKTGVTFRVVDSSCVVPMQALEKREYAAYTIRPKIHKLLPACLTPVALPRVRRRWQGAVPGWHVDVDRKAIREIVASSEIDHRVPPSLSFSGGVEAAKRRLRHFLDQNLRRYAKDKNQPAAHATSGLSPYLHFGHISSLETALAVREYAVEHKLVAGEFLEELIVRRELAFNFARFTETPDRLANLPEWARETLRKHAADAREHQYSREQFETAATHDALWNATQKELLLRGKIHG